jgi:hypothetical protein
LRINKGNKTSEKDIFIAVVELLDMCWTRTNFLHEQLKIDFYNYEETYYNIIEDLLFLKYGEEISNLILWYVYDRFDADGSILELEVTIPGKPKKFYKLKSSLELWNLVEKIQKAI